MAANDAGGRIAKIQPIGGLGRSTIVPNVSVVIPMPSGATPPPASAPSANQSGQSNSGKGTK